MSSRCLTATALAAAFAMASLTPALADREPTAEERVRIEEAMRAAGYTAWEEIELDDDVWEVDDARAADGTQYDLTLDPETIRITGREED
ncbi:PepSY domain-containing protein [Microvirga lenta]|uniref:PepSY domain-containing protein n=1 Tax=Microvirga lenta TaxID=2881337 RepID=UPI001CFE772D|nr:PepSY domain-containing protein [Microvirga lenta]MCB5174667.1 PepSY domain-containing protein [Microvirga lenta]